MRQYTLVFMEQRIGAPQPTPVGGHQGFATFNAADDDAALAYITEHLVGRLKNSTRADLSSLKIVEDAAASGGTRLVDDTHANPQFQETYVRFNPATQSVEVDWESTRTSLLPDASAVRSNA